ncbi:MAG TPA: aldo/keto reductase [Burkholderiaceae bacterium]|nr:aldo/keto reductase [Burkholderiaceae bacterium]
MAGAAIPRVALPSGVEVPALGLGTWKMGERRGARRAEVAAIRRAVELGATLIDTAEMYADGGAEEVVGEALDGLGADAFVVSKVLPSNASARGTIAACERSLKRLRRERIDLYLLHWPGRHPLEETVAAFERLKADGRIGDWGVSNFDAADMAALAALPGGERCATNQVYYALSRRGVEIDLLPWMAARAMPAMAYCPLDEGRLADHPELAPIARELGATPAQVALAWLLHRAAPGDASAARDAAVIAIPKSASVARVEENVAAASLRLAPAQLEALGRAFPRPSGPVPLAVV